MKTQHIIKGIHHVTATVGNAQADYDFYTRTLGLRLVKKTVNFDNNEVYHFYYGTGEGAPGTIMTTFPYEGQGIRQGVPGTGQVAVTGFSVPSAAIPFWQDRLKANGTTTKLVTHFGLPNLQFQDPAGLRLEIIGNDEDQRPPWATTEIPAEMAIRGIFNVSLSVLDLGLTRQFLTEEFGFTVANQANQVTRFRAPGGRAGQYLDVFEDSQGKRGKNGIGIVHHVAWMLNTEEELLALRKRLVDELGLKVTEVKDRKYFRSIYFRIPGGVLFEVATVPPGFGVDESLSELGETLQLPPWEETNRGKIESVLAPVKW